MVFQSRRLASASRVIRKANDFFFAPPSRLAIQRSKMPLGQAGRVTRGASDLLYRDFTMRRLSSLLLLALVTALGCKRGANPRRCRSLWKSAPMSFYRAGPVGLRVESVRLGKIRMRGMMGQDGESKDDVFVVHTRFKLFDDGPVKQPALQRDGGLITFGEGGLKLLGANGNRFKQVSAGGFDGVKGRRSDEAILTAEKPEATDVLTFESVAGADGDLALEIPANYQTKTGEGHYMQPKEPGVYRFRIPKAVWSAAPPSTEAGPGNWATVGPVSVCIESVRVGKVKIQAFGAGSGLTESKDDAFALSVITKLADPAVKVKKTAVHVRFPRRGVRRFLDCPSRHNRRRPVPGTDRFRLRPHCGSPAARRRANSEEARNTRSAHFSPRRQARRTS